MLKTVSAKCGRAYILGAGTRTESIHRLFNHVANLVPRLSVYLHTVSNQAFEW